MSRVLRYAVCMLLVTGSAHAATTTIVTGRRAPALEQLAARELQKYLYAATGSLLPISDGARGDAIAVGTPASNPVVRQFKPAVSALGDEGYLLHTAKNGRRRVLLVTGNTSKGVLYGAYSLLEEYGLGFYLGGDAVPVRKPFRLLDLDISRKPALAIRGTLPWYNFFDSPTAWDFEDYAWFFDNLVKTKNNFIGFHSYDYEPFAAYKADGKYVWGEPVVSTAVSTWGTHPMKTSEFGFGTGRYFHTEYFGSKPSLYRDDRERSIRDSQDLLRKALDYGKARGLKVCVGFEVGEADPTDPAVIERLEKRLRGLVVQYPMLDYVWIWEPEAMGIRGHDTLPLDSDFGAHYRRYQPDFAYLQDPRRITEAVRMTIYTREAYRILKETRPDMRLVVSGWGGDNHLHFSDFYVGMDKILPKDIIFSALDNIVVSDKVSAAYGQLSAGREYWPIPWFEYDGDQWHPQPNAERWLNACRDSLAKGSQGILGIHWRTRDVEESHAVMSQFAWNPKITYQQFYRDYAERSFGGPYADRMARLLMELQSLGYRLVGGSGQTECGGFGWGTPADRFKLQKMEYIVMQLDYIHGEMAKNPEYARQRERVGYLLATCEWATRYAQVARSLTRGGTVAELLDKARAQKEAGNTTESANLAAEGLARLTALGFGQALESYTRHVTNKGELGVLATVNTKAYAAYRAVEKELREIAGPVADTWVDPYSWAGRRRSQPTQGNADAAPGARPAVPDGNARENQGVRPDVGSRPGFAQDTDRWSRRVQSVPRPRKVFAPINLNTVWPVSEPLPVKVVSHIDGADVQVRFRAIGSDDWHATKLERRAERYFEGAIGFPVDAPNGIELQILHSSPMLQTAYTGWGGRMRAGGPAPVVFPVAGTRITEVWPGKGMTHQVALIPPVKASAAVSSPKARAEEAMDLRVRKGDGKSLVLEWKGSPGRYEIGRSTDGGPFERIKVTSDTWFEDRDVSVGKSYGYSVTPVGAATSAERAVTMQDVAVSKAPMLSAPTLTASSGPGRVRLRWGAAELGTDGFQVFGASSPDGPWEALTSNSLVPADNWGGHLYVARDETGKQGYYFVLPIDRDGQAGMKSNVVSCTALPPGDLGLVWSTDFDGNLNGGSWGGPPAFEPVNGVPAAHFRNGNCVIVPDSPDLNPDGEFTVELWAKLEQPGSIPVLLSHGMWAQDGYFVQTFGGQVRFFLHGVGTLDAGHMTSGRWYHIAGTYDGFQMLLYIDGRQVGRLPATGTITPTGRPLHIGRYDMPGQEWETDCRITGVRLYSTALAPDDVKQGYDRLAGKLR